MPTRRSRDEDIDQDISWRTEELGPELRRALFEKAMRKPSANGDPPNAQKASKRTERPGSGSKKESG